MNKRERIAFYEEQVDFENAIVDKAQASVEGIQNIMIRELILSSALDSKKHANMLNALVSLLTRFTPSVPEEISSEIKDSITEHIQMEAQTIETYQKLLDSIDDESEKVVIKAILNDEVKHHSLLRTINKMIVEKLTLSEKEFWDMVEKEGEYEYVSYLK
ncbi:MAG: ferritin family protein [Candidatus Hodarchaeales archaeon]|jgi:rubrerythrin